MADDFAIPFFIYNKQKKEAYFLVLDSSRSAKRKQVGGVNYGEQRVIQEDELGWSSRSALGA